MADLAAIRQGIATNLSRITSWQFSPYMLADPTPPGGHVFPAEIQYDETMMRGWDRHVLTVQVFVSDATGDIGQQRLLDQFLAGSGDKSIKEKLEADPTLGGACDDLRVTSFSGYRRVVLEGRPPFLVAELQVEVHAQGN